MLPTARNGPRTSLALSAYLSAVAAVLVLLAVAAPRASAGPGEMYKPCYWSNAGCTKGDILGFDTKNSGFYPSSTGLATSGVSGRSKSLRVNRSGVGYLGWWYSSNAYHDVSFAGSFTHQHWCGNYTSTPQSQWCDMWLNGF